jgi:hypothetical protein
LQALSPLTGTEKNGAALRRLYFAAQSINLLDDPLVGIDSRKFPVKGFFSVISEYGVVVIADRDESSWDFVEKRIDFSEFPLIES